MRAQVWAIVALLLMTVGVASAGDVTLQWTGDAKATSYEIEQSVDSGATWTVVLTVLPTECTGTPPLCTTTYSAPSTGMVLFRYVAKNDIGRTIRFDAGTWHCESCKPPTAVSHVSIQ
ncbi:MAG TPA: hypothetical protein VNP04_21525 [Alphaproteobacteria bacterium]|nr:hypothetical protein [Alphaproteobacteria bacterium]